MAVNMALAAQYAVGVSLHNHKRCQLLVSKKPKAAIVGAASNNPNPAIKHEAATLVSTTTHLQFPIVHRNWVTKRGKRIMAENQQATAPTDELTSDEPEITKCTFKNESALNLELDEYKKWSGSGDPPETIYAKTDGKLDHYAGYKGSFAGAAYTLGDSKIIKWIVVWSNREGRDNQVFTQILDGRAGFSWNEIKEKFEDSKATTNTSQGSLKGYVSDVTIDPSTPSPNMEAKLRKSS